METLFGETKIKAYIKNIQEKFNVATKLTKDCQKTRFLYCVRGFTTAIGHNNVRWAFFSAFCMYAHGVSEEI